MKANFLVLPALVIAVFWIALPGFAKIYFSENFESYKDGDDLVKKVDFWVMTDLDSNPIGGGIASTKQSLPNGHVSALFEEKRSMGFSFEKLKLPKTYVVSCWFYHDAKQSPPPQAIVNMAESLTSSGTWLGVGTMPEAVEPQNYTYRDKKGTKIYEDTGIPRRTDWVNFVYMVEQGKTKLLIDGKEVYEAKFGSEYFGMFRLTREYVSGGIVFLDDIYIADTVDEIPKGTAVKPLGKLSVTWGMLKSSSH